MKSYDVYHHPTQGYQAVKQGFCWPAFFFTVIWAFVKKMWGIGIAVGGVLLLLSIIEAAFEEGGSGGGALVMLLIQLALYIFIGLNANDWRRDNLQKRGYEKLCTMQANTPDAAIGAAAKPSDQPAADLA
jgi:hypothetical protein